MNFSKQLMNNQYYSSADIIKKCKKYPQFLQELEQVEVEYSHDLNMALYASVEDIEQMGVFQIHNQKMLFMNFYAYLMPPYQEYASKFYLLWIRLLDEQLRLNVGKRYSIVYYHTFCQSNYPYNFFVGIFKKLPIYYYAMLDKIYTVEATFFLRKSAGLFDFGRLYKLFERKLQNIEKIGDFVNNPQIQKYNLFEKLPEKLMVRVQEKAKKRLMKEQQNTHNIPHTQSTFKNNPPPIIHAKKDFLTIQLSAHKTDKDGIPVPLLILINTLKTHPNFLELEGIFRKSGSIEQEEEIIVELQTLTAGESLQKLADYSGFAIAGVVKKFFTKLLTPLVPYSVYNYILAMMAQSTVKPEEEVAFMLDFLNQLPLPNKKIMFYLMAFLKKEVVTRQEKNKMNNYNMSVCFCPCIFRSQTPTLADLLNSGKFAGILNIFFNRFEEIAGMEERGSKDKEKNEAISRKSKNWANYRISTA